MTSARYIVGDVRQVLATLPESSVDLVLTSPPFLALRSYLPADHPAKPLEIGSESTPGEFIDTLLDVVEACSRVLAPHGSMCFELGDTYSGSGGAGGDYNDGGLRAGQAKWEAPNYRMGRIMDHDSGRRNPGPGWPLDKSLCLIPEIFRFSLVYGFNPLSGRQTPRWRARNVVRWCRPNPPVGALGDKFRPATSEMVVICQDRRRYFDLDAVRGPWARDYTGETPTKPNREADRNGGGRKTTVRDAVADPAGSPPLDWWKISTQPYSGSHYATWPEDLCATPIKAMCPLKVCQVCGKPSERISEVERIADKNDATRTKDTGRLNGHNHPPEVGWEMAHRTVGWTDCGHDDWRTGVVLDPFAGSGTTLQVATGHGRDAIGIDLDARNADLALGRVGPLLLTIEAEAAA